MGIDSSGGCPDFSLCNASCKLEAIDPRHPYSCDGRLPSRQLMAELFALGRKVPRVVRVGWGNDRHLIDDLQVEAVVDEGVDLFRVVRQEADLAEAEVLEDL